MPCIEIVAPRMILRLSLSVLVPARTRVIFFFFSVGRRGIAEIFCTSSGHCWGSLFWGDGIPSGQENTMEVASQYCLSLVGFFPRELVSFPISSVISIVVPVNFLVSFLFPVNCSYLTL